MSTFKEILKEHIEHRAQLSKLAEADLKKTYSGSVLGWSWALIRPSILIFVYWFAFSFGLRKGGDVNGYPFFLWLIAGVIPWYFMRQHYRRCRFNQEIQVSCDQDKISCVHHSDLC